MHMASGVHVRQCNVHEDCSAMQLQKLLPALLSKLPFYKTILFASCNTLFLFFKSCDKSRPYLH